MRSPLGARRRSSYKQLRVGRPLLPAALLLLLLGVMLLLAGQWLLLSRSVTVKKTAAASTQVPGDTLREATLPTIVDAVYNTATDDARLPQLPRPGEPTVSMHAYLQCLATCLGLAPAIPVAAPGPNLSDAAFWERRRSMPELPLLLVPMVLEVVDHRAFLCTIDVPVGTIIFVQNGAVAETDRFLAHVERAFGYTGRVVVRRHPRSIGFAGAVNVGIDAALRTPTKPPLQPLLLVSNSDVRFPSGLLASRLRHAKRLIEKDQWMLAALRAEVATESREGTAPRGAWQPAGNVLVTSPLLPERVRRMPAAAMRRAFENHTGVFFFHTHADGSAFLLSPLALSVVGYWDENFYPAYFEDSDYWFRLQCLGFRADVITCGDNGRANMHDGVNGSNCVEAIHYSNALRQSLGSSSAGRAGSREAGRPTALSPSAAAALNEVAVLFRNPPSYLYAKAKWNAYSGSAISEEDAAKAMVGTHGGASDSAPLERRYALPFGPFYRVPVDVWVRDEVRTNATRLYLRSGCHARTSPALRYDLRLVRPYALERWSPRVRVIVLLPVLGSLLLLLLGWSWESPRYLQHRLGRGLASSPPLYI